MIYRRLALPTALVASALLLAGCAGGAPGPDGSGTAGTGGDRISVVASTNVYGSIAEAIGGDRVEVTSLIDSFAQDPHEYEASARDQLRIGKADLVIENGGGFDPFVDGLVRASGSTAPVLTAVEFSSHWDGAAAHDDSAHDDSTHDEHAHDDEHAHEGETPGAGDHADGDGHDHIEGFNEHVFYDPAAMADLAAGVASKLEALDPAGEKTFTENLETFRAGIAEIDTDLAAIKKGHDGEGVFVTEPLPLYLTEAAGLVNKTPDEFSEAVEEGQDVPPATLLRAIASISSGQVAVVITNAQAGGAETERVATEAKDAGVPTLAFSELVPDGKTYLTWMRGNAEELAGALDR